MVIWLNIETQTATIHQFISLGLLDVITVAFEHNEQARSFQPLPWFGPAVTSEPRYQPRSIAVAGLSAVREVEATNPALDSLLDALDNRFGWQPQPARAEQLIAPQPRALASPELNSEDEDEPGDLAIEDSVIRELARSLSPGAEVRRGPFELVRG